MSCWEPSRTVSICPAVMVPTGRALPAEARPGKLSTRRPSSRGVKQLADGSTQALHLPHVSGRNVGVGDKEEVASEGGAMAAKVAFIGSRDDPGGAADL